MPIKERENRLQGMPKYTGDFEDGFGNKISVYAASNPVFTGLKPSRLYARATGFGVIRFNKKKHTITFECYPRRVETESANQIQYPGWPVTVEF